jgi:hypothetical protein
LVNDGGGKMIEIAQNLYLVGGIILMTFTLLGRGALGLATATGGGDRMSQVFLNIAFSPLLLASLWLIWQGSLLN